MDGNAMKYTFGQMEALSEDIKARGTNVEGVLADLQGQINSLSQSWDGEARTLYMAQKAKWEESADSMRQTIARIATAVATTTADARTTEGQNAARFS